MVPTATVSQPKRFATIDTGLPTTIRLVTRPIASLAASAVSVAHVKSTPFTHTTQVTVMNHLIGHVRISQSKPTAVSSPGPGGEASPGPPSLYVRYL